jgi:energy-coupling factor transport system ATP-binding protein
VEAFTVENFTFTYPLSDEPALKEVSFSVDHGEFITICGKSGCGKSTMLRNLKTVLSPHGAAEGRILFNGNPLAETDLREQTQKIGFVLQNPDNQIVTDKVWHELAFGLESLGFDSKTIRLRVAEMASFFGIQNWFNKNVSELSGGQRQLLNLASIMAMQPEVLILDEPTSQLDPIAACDFLETVKKINREIGTTIIMTEHRLEEVLSMSDRAIVLDDGRIIFDDAPMKVGDKLAKKNHDMFLSMPSPMQVYAALTKAAHEKSSGLEIGESKAALGCPITVREGRSWLTAIFNNRPIVNDHIPVQAMPENIKLEHMSEIMVELKDVWFRYSKNEPDVIKGLSVRIPTGRFHCIVGGNGTGKSTALFLISGIQKPYRGKVLLKGKQILKSDGLFNGLIGVLPQNPQTLFVEKTVELDLMEILDRSQISPEEKKEKVKLMAETLEITNLLQMHPYDLSGGEQQRAALAKVLLLEPQLLLLDEPTKGIDNYFKAKLADILKLLIQKGVTIVMVSHDIEFCAKYADVCSMFFDGSIITTNTPNKFFSGNSFYTTAANRMSRHLFPNAVTTKDVTRLCMENLVE